MLGCMNVHRRGEANAVAVIRISGHRKAALCRVCALDFAAQLQNVAAESPFVGTIGEIKVEPVNQEAH